jgi:hypothetical protein
MMQESIFYKFFSLDLILLLQFVSMILTEIISKVL